MKPPFCGWRGCSRGFCARTTNGRPYGFADGGDVRGDLLKRDAREVVPYGFEGGANVCGCLLRGRIISSPTVFDLISS